MDSLGLDLVISVGSLKEHEERSIRDGGMRVSTSLQKKRVVSNHNRQHLRTYLPQNCHSYLGKLILKKINCLTKTLNKYNTNSRKQ